jgi:2-methylisocitrate lyase-like PEP mutase family enzyme
MSNAVTTFRQLHVNTTPLQLPNAWDAGGARLFESLGAMAIATTSAGMAWALGYRDGRQLPIDEAVAAAARMMRVLTIPLSFDIENGYSSNPKTVADNVMRLVDLGIAGINIEDGSDTSTLLTSKIEAIRNAVAKANTDLFVNARSDVFLANLVEEGKRVEESIARGRLYAATGADGFFLPGIVKPEEIKAVVAGSALPLNALAWPGLGDAACLGKLGVRRLSAGSAIAQTIWNTAEKLGREFLQGGSSEAVNSEAKPYSELQALFGENAPSIE